MFVANEVALSSSSTSSGHRLAVSVELLGPAAVVHQPRDALLLLVQCALRLLLRPLRLVRLRRRLGAGAHLLEQRGAPQRQAGLVEGGHRVGEAGLWACAGMSRAEASAVPLEQRAPAAPWTIELDK